MQKEKIYREEFKEFDIEAASILKLVRDIWFL